jgi:hypothetical protein
VKAFCFHFVVEGEEEEFPLTQLGHDVAMTDLNTYS